MVKTKARLIGTSVAARILERSPERVRQLHAEGQLPAVCVSASGMRLFDERVVRRLVMARTRQMKKASKTAEPHVVNQ